MDSSTLSGLAKEVTKAAATALLSTFSPTLAAVTGSTIDYMYNRFNNETDYQKLITNSTQSTITQWAKVEKFDDEAIDRGLSWAKQYITDTACTLDDITEKNYDADNITKLILEKAKRKSIDNQWGKEPEYAIAEKAIHVTYTKICELLKQDGGQPLSALLPLRQSIIEQGDQIHALKKRLLDPADKQEVIKYLERQIEEWNFSPWVHNKKPSQLEQDLRVSEQDRPISISQAQEGVWMLTVLGDPGSGKTWLARSLARKAAETALEQLQSSSSNIKSVEVPLLSTAATWAKQPCKGFEGFVEAALPGETQQRMRRLVLQEGIGVLAIADSLDEGVTTHEARTLLNSLKPRTRDRLVITSRPAAWRSASSSLDKSKDTRVVTLQELRYPEDVHKYVESWFADQPQSARHLINQLEQRSELAATAINPLILTFYCMLTEQDPERNLPLKRRDLYRTITDLLLAGNWGSGENNVNLEECRTTLQRWAWESIKDASTPIGLVDWPELIVTEQAPPELDKPLDHVAPKQQHPASSQHFHSKVERKFLHHSLWEYLVAEHISTLSASDAAKVILPHIWYDPDWENVLPMAIAAHQERNKLMRILWNNHTKAPDPAQQIVNSQLERLLLKAVDQTPQQDWKKRWLKVTERLKSSPTTDLHVDNPINENSGNTVPNEYFFSADNFNLKEELSRLTRSCETQDGPPLHSGRTARQVSKSFTHAKNEDIPGLVSELLTLHPNCEDLMRALKRVDQALSSDSAPSFMGVVSELIGALSSLEPQREDKLIACNIIFKTLPPLPTEERLYGYHPAFATLMRQLHQLEPSDDMETDAKIHLLAAMRSVNLWRLPILTDAFKEMRPGQDEQTKAVQVLLDRLTTDDESETVYLVQAAHALAPKDGGWQEKAAAIIKGRIDNPPKGGHSEIHLDTLLEALRMVTSVDKWLGILHCIE